MNSSRSWNGTASSGATPDSRSVARASAGAPLLLAAFVLAGPLGGGSSAAQPTPVCASASYIVEGEPLIGATAFDGPDAVVLDLAGGPGDVAEPRVLIRSGCPHAPVEVQWLRRSTRITATLAGCAGLAGPAELKARISADCRTMTGRFRAVPAGGTKRRGRRFRGLVGGPVAGRVAGVLTARHGDETFTLGGAAVNLVDRATGMAGESVATDVSGRFTTGEHPEGSYDVCAKAPGFVDVCAAEPVEIAAGGSALQKRDLETQPLDQAVHGEVRLADGSACFHAASPPLAEVTAVVSLPQAGASAIADQRGRYLLAGLPGGGSFEFRVVCEGLDVKLPVEIDSAALSGARPVDLVLPNSPPRIGLLAAWRDGNGVRTTAPGTTVEARALATDPDRDELRFTWIDSEGRVEAGPSSSLQWKLSSAPAQNVMTLIVGDGRGGYDEEQVVVRTGESVARFVGRVFGSDGQPLAGAKVRFDGASVATDAAGTFRVKVPAADRHVGIIRSAGHAPWSQVFYDEAVGLEIRLRASLQGTFAPGEAIALQDGPDDPLVEIAGDALADSQGNPPASDVRVDVYAFDKNLGEFPGDRRGRDRLGNPLNLTLHAAVSVEIADATGAALNVAPGRTARVSFKIPAALAANPPATVPLLRYDESTAIWEQRGGAQLEGDRYLGFVSSFSFWSIGEPEPDSACLRVFVDDNSMERPFRLRIQEGMFGQGEIVADLMVTEELTPIYGLPAHTDFRLLVSPKTALGEVTTIRHADTDDNADPPYPAYPYLGCSGVQIKASLPTGEWLYALGYGNDQASMFYYQMIGAIPAKDTFSKWLAANAFPANYQSGDVAFFNPNELGLGRRVNCHKTILSSGPRIACFVTKFGEVGGNADTALEDAMDQSGAGDTVAMEYGPGPGSAWSVKFYIYGANGNIKTNTAFDTQGSIKHVPNVCLHCHGGWNGAYEGHKDEHFVALDPHAYVFPESGPYSRVNQQERIRELNAMIAQTEDFEGPVWDVIDAIYPGGVFTPGSQAVPEPVPAGWTSDPTIWEEVAKPSCRTCHMHRPGVDWPTGQSMRSNIWGNICSGYMPHAMAPQLRLWRTSDPFLPDVIQDWGGFVHCSDPDDQNQKPTISITEPANDSEISYGGLSFVHFEATAQDAEDGASCCSIQWRDEDANEIIGYGSELDYVFPTAGPHTIRAIAFDSKGTPSFAAKLDLVLTNDPPAVAIVVPSPGQVLFRNVPYTFEGTSSDMNDAFLTLPCSSLQWASSKPGDEAKTGCQPQFFFTSNGARTITLTGTDSLGASDSFARNITVVDAPPGQPPIATIIVPTNNQVVNPFFAAPLIGNGSAPGGGGPVQLQWFVKQGNVETLIADGPVADWTAIDFGFGNCGYEPVDILLRATNANGTGPAAVKHVYLDFPVC